MADNNQGSIGALLGTSDRVGTKTGLHVIGVDAAGNNALEAISSNLGTVNDTSVTGDSTGTVSMKLRGMNRIQSDVWDSVNHRWNVAVQNTPAVSFDSGLISTSAPAGGSSALLVRIAGGPSSATDALLGVRVFDSSNGPLADSTQRALRVTSVDPGGASSTQVSITGGNVTITPAAGYQSTSAPAGNSSAMLVRIAGGPSSATDAVLGVRVFDSSNGPIADSTQRALRVTSVDVGGSTQVSISTGNVTISPASGFQSTSAPAGNSSAMLVRIAGGPSSATDAVLGVRVFDSSNGPLADSTQRALRITSVDVGGSTQVSISTGNVTISPASGFQSTSAPAGNSSAMLIRIVGGPSSAADCAIAVQPVAGSTWAVRPLQSSAADLLTTVYQSTASALLVTVYQSTASALLATVTPSAGSTWAVRPLQSSAADLQMTATPAAGSVWTITPAAGYQSTSAPAGNSSALLVRIAGGPSSATDCAIAVQPVAGSTWAVRPLQSSAADLQMTATPASGSTWNTRTFCSSQADFLTTVYQSSQSALLVTVYQSTASALLATVTPTAGSTWNVRPLQSSAADLQMTATPASGSTWNVRPLQSSAADLHVTAVLQDGSSNALESTTGQPSTNARGLVVRQVLGGLTTFVSTNLTSTATTVISSNAASRGYVYAYSITSTVATATELIFMDGATQKWPLVLQAVSSGISGANLSVSPPGYLFAGSTGAPITLNVSSTGVFKVGVAYWLST